MTCGEWVVAMNWHFGNVSLMIPDDPPLPSRMEVQFDFVDQIDRFGFGSGVLHLRIGLRQAARKVEHHCQQAPLAIRELGPTEEAYRHD